VTNSGTAGFVGRAAELAALRTFTARLADPGNARGGAAESAGLLLLVTGPGGMGKSTLLSRFTTELSTDGHPGKDLSYVFVDWGAPEHVLTITDAVGPPPEDMMAVIAGRLRSIASGWQRFTRRSPFDEFDKALSRVPRGQAATRTIGGEPGSARGAALSSIAGAITSATPLAPASKAVELIVKEAYGAVSSARSARDTSAASSDRATCRAALVRGIRSLTSNRPLVVVLDTCELLGDAAQDLQLLIRECGPRVLWVLGIRMEAMDDAAADSATHRYHDAAGPGRVQQLPLGGLSTADIGDYLHHHARVTGDDTLVDLLEELTRGVPLAVLLATSLLARGVSLPDLLDDLQPSPDAAELIRELAGRYLRHVSTIGGLQDDLTLLYSLALLPDHVSDYRLLAALWDVPESKIHRLLRDLADRHDFVHSRHMANPQQVMHSLVRDTLRRSLFDEDKRSLMKDANERAIGYLERFLAASPLRHLEQQLSRDDSDDHVQGWQSAALSLLWHTFWVDAANGIALTRHLYPPAALLAPSFAERQAAVIRQHLGSPGVRGRRMLEAVAQVGSYLDADSLAAALKDLSRDPVAEHPYAADLPLSLYQRLLTISHGDQLDSSPGDGIKQIVEVDALLRERYDDRVPAEQTVELVKAEALRLSASAAVSGAYDDAVEALAVVLAWSPDDPTAHRYLALAKAALGDGAAAEREFKIAIRADPGNAEVHAAFGELLILSGAGDEHGRRAALDWALSVGTSLSALVLRGLLPAPLAPGDRAAETREFLERALETEGSGTPLRNAELHAIAHAGLGRTDVAAGTFAMAAGSWTRADKYQRAVYDLLACHHPVGAEALRTEWLKVISRFPEAAKPWG
jgi:tetratricopeptide (TPR) repeat protein